MMSIPPKVRSPFVWSLTKRQVCSLTLIITLLCSSCLIAGYSYAASIGAQKYPTSYMEGGPTGAYDYMIYTFQNDTNTYYAAKNSFGDNIDSWTSTDAATVIQNALDTATGDQYCRIYLNLVGIHNISRTIIMDKGSQYLEGKADSSTPPRGTWLALANNVNDDVIRINGTVNHDYYGISRIWINGNKWTQTTGNGITVTGSALHVELHHIQIEYAKNYGLSVQGQIMEITSVGASNCGSRGLYFQALDYKSRVTSCWAFNNPTNIVINNCEDVYFSDIKSYNSSLYSGILLENCRKNNFYGLNSQDDYLDGIKFYGSRNNTIFGGIVENSGRVGANTYPAVTFTSNGAVHSTNNMLVGLQIQRTTTTPKYSVYEADANQDYNFIQSPVSSGAGTAEILLQGANSKLVGFNGTTWVNPTS